MKTLQSFLLFLLAFILYIGLFPRVLVEMFYRACKGTLTKYLYNVARSIDQSGNATYPLLRELLFTKKDSHPFGDIDETISGVLGKNKKRLTKMGKGLVWILEKLDPGHMEKAIEEDEKGFYF